MSLQTQGTELLPMLAASAWQMSPGERATLEGVLAQVRPTLALEVGTAQGGSLRRVAAYSEEVHSFDLVAPDAELAALSNVTFHTGDSHVLLPETLSELAAAEKSVDFILIDGDHTAQGVRRDIEDVLESSAVTRTLIVLHDTMNPDVRRGILEAGAAEHPKVAQFELDLIPGYLSRREPYRLQMWGGLGLIVVDAGRSSDVAPYEPFHELFSVLRPAVEAMAELEAQGTPLDGLRGAEVESAVRAALERSRAELTRQTELVEVMRNSLSWRLTAPLRRLKLSLAQRWR